MLQVTTLLGPSHKAAARLGSSGLSLLCASGKWGTKRRFKKCLTYMLSGIAFGAVRSPTVPSLEHGLSPLATPERRPATPQAARLGRSGESGQRRVLGNRRPDVPVTRPERQL